MPPAFNLSQDQTLQLKDFDLQLLKYYSCITQSKRGLLLCEHLLDALPLAGTTLAGLSFARRVPAGGAIRSSAHTYRLRIFKERAPEGALRQLVAGRGFEPLTFGL